MRHHLSVHVLWKANVKTELELKEITGGNTWQIKREGFRNRQRKPETIINTWHPWKEGEGLNRRRLGCVRLWESLCQPSLKQTTHWKSPRWAELAWPQAPPCSVITLGAALGECGPEGMLWQIRRRGTCRLLANYSYSSSLLKGGQNSKLINGFNAETIKLVKQYEYTYYASLSCHSATWKPFRVLPFRPNHVQTPQQSTYVLSGSGPCFFWSTPFPPLLHKHPTYAPARRIYSCPTCRMPVLLLWLFTRSFLSCCVWFPNPI